MFEINYSQLIQYEILEKLVTFICKLIYPVKNFVNHVLFQVVPGPQTKEADALQDWASELRPSMRKLRQGMDSLCKTARLGKNQKHYFFLPSSLF